MSSPRSASTFLEVLMHEGLAVVRAGDWRTHNRNHKSPWGPVNGVMIHHTATRGTEATVRICCDGHPELPGPLCHGVIAKAARQGRSARLHDGLPARPDP